MTEEAARQFARLAQLLRRYGNEPHATAHFLIRLLFCLFAEDVGILPDGLFTKLVTQPHRTAGAVSEQLRQLFAAMASGGSFGADEIPLVDGGLFNDDSTLDLDGDSLHILAEVSGLDWSSVEPSVLGTLFVRSLDPDKRSQLGAHYTSEADILLIVEPVLMAPLRRRWAEVKAEAEAKAEKRDLIAGSKSSPQKSRQLARIEAELFGLLRRFREELAAVQVLDAACGSGNFLYVALRLLLDLEWEVITLARRPGRQPGVPRGLARATARHRDQHLRLRTGADHHLDRLHPVVARPRLRPPGRADPETAGRDPADGRDTGRGQESGDSGQGSRGRGQGAGVAGGGCDRRESAVFGRKQDPQGVGRRIRGNAVQALRGPRSRVRRPGVLLVREGAGADRRGEGEAGRIVGDAGDPRRGESESPGANQGNRRYLLGAVGSGVGSDGATVHVSMVGFDDGIQTNRELDNHVVVAINADLTTLVDVTTAQLLHENQLISFQGPSPKASFDIPADLASRMLTAPVNVNGRPNSDVVRPVASAIDLAQGSRGIWTIDFGLMAEDEATQYEMPFEYVRQHILPERQNRRADFRGRWWQYARPRPEMREALKDVRHYIATPRVSKHRVFVWLSSEVLANDGTIVFAREDDYFFGVLHSRLHEIWSRRMGTQLREAESGCRYTPTTTFETFPFPWPPGREPADDPCVQAIAAAAADLVAKRDAWLTPTGASEAELKQRTLTNLYNARPAWLDLAHRALDAAVLAAYGWPKDLTDDEILARLLALNLERAGKART